MGRSLQRPSRNLQSVTFGNCKNDDGDPGPDRDPRGVVFSFHYNKPTAVQPNGKRKKVKKSRERIKRTNT
eukprot:scaffold4059_cov177-Amphora_coffeaeformis.AAC.15